MKGDSVGELRMQSAYKDANERVVIVSDDPELQNLVIVECYPDTVNEEGEWESTFKIEVARKI